MLKTDPFRVPINDRELLEEPALSGYPALMEANRNLDRDIKIDGEPLAEVARQARTDALDSAINYTRNLGLDTNSVDPSAPLIASGHQPTFYHPGIAIKPIAIARQASESGATALNITVDSDEFKDESVPVPTVQESLVRMDHTLCEHQTNHSYETVQIDQVMLINNLKGIANLIDNSRLNQPGSAFRQFLGRIGSTKVDQYDYTALSILLRRLWAGHYTDRLLELPVSRLCGGDAFAKFANDIINNLGEFAEVYNSELARYRKEHKLRYPANPFPPLSIDGQWRETPFWLLRNGERTHLYADSSGQLKDDKGDLFRFDETDSKGYGIRPRAITLSIYLRLFVCELFVHGVGGAKYDTITDPIIERFYKVEPPAYTCLTATLHPGIVAENPTNRIEEINHTLREIKHHPEKMADTLPELHPLETEKIKLVDWINKPGADKKLLGGMIADINNRMSALLAPVIKELKEELKTLEPKEREHQVAHARDYPYFLFTPEQVAALLG